MSQQGASATTTVMRLASEQALRGTLVVGGGGREGRRVCNYISGMWNPTPIPLSLPVGWAVRFPPISTKQKGVRMLTSTEKHVPGVMTSLLMSSPPISISHQLFRCRYSNSREWFQALLHFPALPPEHPRELARRLWQGPLGGGGWVCMPLDWLSDTIILHFEVQAYLQKLLTILSHVSPSHQG